MTTEYNVTTYGTLINTDGVLSDFSASNYATLPNKFAPSGDSFEIVIKFKVDSIDTSGNTYPTLLASVDTSTAYSGYNLQVYEGALYFEVVQSDTPVVVVQDNTKVLNANTDYYAKVAFNGSAYTTYISTDGTTWVQQASTTSSIYYQPTNIELTILGKQYSTDANNVLNGSIDLNESYININGIRWWQGVTSTSTVQTRIQLRHDTAANWTSVNPILLEGEVGLELDTLKQKVGDGLTAWNNLAYSVNIIDNKAFDGQWVFLNQRVINSATSLVGTTPLGPYTVNVPNDGHKYELLLETQIYSDNAVGNFCYIRVNSSEFGITLLQQVSDRAASNWGITSGTIVLGTNRQLTVSRSNINSFKGYVNYLVVVAYRRIGTNS